MSAPHASTSDIAPTTAVVSSDEHACVAGEARVNAASFSSLSSLTSSAPASSSTGLSVVTTDSTPVLCTLKRLSHALSALSSSSSSSSSSSASFSSFASASTAASSATSFCSSASSSSAAVLSAPCSSSLLAHSALLGHSDAVDTSAAAMSACHSSPTSSSASSSSSPSAAAAATSSSSAPTARARKRVVADDDDDDASSVSEKSDDDNHASGDTCSSVPANSASPPAPADESPSRDALDKLGLTACPAHKLRRDRGETITLQLWTHAAHADELERACNNSYSHFVWAVVYGERGGWLVHGQRVRDALAPAEPMCAPPVLRFLVAAQRTCNGTWVAFFLNEATQQVFEVSKPFKLGKDYFAHVSRRWLPLGSAAPPAALRPTELWPRLRQYFLTTCQHQRPQRNKEREPPAACRRKRQKTPRSAAATASLSNTAHFVDTTRNSSPRTAAAAVATVQPYAPPATYPHTTTPSATHLSHTRTSHSAAGSAAPSPSSSPPPQRSSLATTYPPSSARPTSATRSSSALAAAAAAADAVDDDVDGMHALDYSSLTSPPPPRPPRIPGEDRFVDTLFRKLPPAVTSAPMFLELLNLHQTHQRIHFHNQLQQQRDVMSLQEQNAALEANNARHLDEIEQLQQQIQTERLARLDAQFLTLVERALQPRP